MDMKRRLEEINHLKIFSGNANPALAKKICEHLSIQLGNAYVGRFPDGEIDLKVNEDVRGADVFLVQPTCSPVNENLTELLIFIDCLKRASAARITAVLPYYGYEKQAGGDKPFKDFFRKCESCSGKENLRTPVNSTGKRLCRPFSRW